MVPNTLIRESFALFAKVTCTCLFAKVSSNCFFTNENEINGLSLQRVWFFYHLFFWASLFRLYSISTNEGITKKKLESPLNSKLSTWTTSIISTCISEPFMVISTNPNENAMHLFHASPFYFLMKRQKKNTTSKFT